jgi:polynucleotide 5'-kinase involved in rRNA processing
MELEEAYSKLLKNPGVVMLLGGIDAGKTTFAVELVKRADDAGIPSAIVDADIGQSAVGPPTTVGLRLCIDLRDLSRSTLRAADSLSFVGALSPRGHLLPLVTGTARMVGEARSAGCRLIVIDTTGYVSGIHAQVLKFHKMNLVEPDFVVAFQRGGELEPLVGIAQRFTPSDVFELEVPEQVRVRTAEERVAVREEQFAAYFEPGVSRWRVKPTVFMPTLPPEFDLALLDGLVVGMEDGKGACAGIGVLEHDAAEDMLRMVSPVSEGVRGLRLGSLRIDVQGRSRGPVDLGELFSTE